MGEFVYLFGGIGEKRPVDRELNFHAEMDRRISGWNDQKEAGSAQNSG
jgi:hypothetical protein